jgi:tetratricopeptide (TPR) repeat protein
MKRLISVAALLTLAISGLFAQTGAFQEATGDNYRVFSEVSLAHAQETADMLDAFLELYNQYLHFDVDALSTKLKVRIFANKTNFDSYLSTLIPQKRDSFVYLQYKDLAKSELLGFYMDDDSFEKAVVHHGFIQFLKAFVPNPPLWLQKGFAVYLEKSEYDAESGTAIFKENLVWVKTIKNIAAFESGYDLIELDDLLQIDVDSANLKIESFYAESWALVSFLADSRMKQYNRMLWDTLSVMSAEATMTANSYTIIDDVFSWVTTDQFYADFQEYIESVKTFPELVKDGMAFYSDGDLDASESSFLKAIGRNEKHDIPYYYLGLINYAKRDYSLAEYYYLTSQQMGGELGLTYYALGVNAYADNRFDVAKDYLRQASDADPFGYGEKTSALLQKIEGMGPG